MGPIRIYHFIDMQTLFPWGRFWSEIPAPYAAMSQNALKGVANGSEQNGSPI